VKGCDKLADAGRRAFFARTATVAAGAAVTAALPPGPTHAAPAPARLDYPSTRLANVGDLKINEPMNIAYPDADSPGVLLKLGTRVEGAAGADGDLVAFSTMCPHKGYPLNYTVDDRTLNCPGHYSRFDVEKGGLEIWGHATQNLAQFGLRVDGKGDVYAESVDELIYGRPSNLLA